MKSGSISQRIKEWRGAFAKTIRFHWRQTRLPKLLVFSSVFYFLWVVSAGVQESARYRAIGIDIFDYASVSDFVLVPFADIRALGALAVLAGWVLFVYVVGLLLAIVLNRMESKKKAGSEEPAIALSRPAFRLFGITIIVYLIAILSFGAYFYNASYNNAWLSNYLRDSEDKIRVTSNFGNASNTAPSSEEFLLFGTAGEFVFLVRDLDKCSRLINLDVVILPIASIQSMSKPNRTIDPLVN